MAHASKAVGYVERAEVVPDVESARDLAMLAQTHALIEIAAELRSLRSLLESVTSSEMGRLRVHARSEQL